MVDTRDVQITEIITFHGVVQGVGFRPTVYRIAQHLGMKGSVRNMGGIVQLACTDTPERISLFVKEIQKRKPPMARISNVSRKTINPVIFHEFSIGPSSVEEDEIALIPSDIAMCDDCLQEFYDPANPRYKHPFISCTNCGPRYSILERLPYDRETTTMSFFEMCEFCSGEYSDPSSRRYHAQTISCHECGPQPLGKTMDGDPVETAIAVLKSGDVLALKGVGGYYLSCSPFDEDAVQKLRSIKKREQKPFAVMFRSVEQIREYCTVREQEEKALVSPERPIVLLEQLQEKGKVSLSSGVNNTSRFTGAFLPSFGLQYLLLDAVGPLIMTSANVTELPIITNDPDMENMSSISGMLYNERRIAAGLDDSVVRVIDGSVQMIRRSKGYVPSPVYVQSERVLTKDTKIFAAGAHLKSVMAFSAGAYSYPSRHIGDLDSIESENIYRETFSQMKEFFNLEPSLAVCDMHPRYFPTVFSEALGIPLLYAQHHHSHIASVMAEHGLKGPVIGIAFDGTGYGADGAIWGGEILICEGAEYRRYSHLKYIDMIGGDSSMKDGWKSALSHLQAREAGPLGGKEFEIDIAEIVNYCRVNKTLEPFSGFDVTSEAVETAKAALLAGVNTVRTSSMGRLFDAVSAMLGIHYENRYEGECAIMLENAAQKALEENEILALAFHMNVAEVILEQCLRAKDALGIRRVCLSGGTFQNKILMEETLRLLRSSGFICYYNINVPPNDGGIALGQNYIGMASLNR